MTRRSYGNLNNGDYEVRELCLCATYVDYVCYIFCLFDLCYLILLVCCLCTRRNSKSKKKRGRMLWNCECSMKSTLMHSPYPHFTLCCKSTFSEHQPLIVTFFDYTYIINDKKKHFYRVSKYFELF